MLVVKRCYERYFPNDLLVFRAFVSQALVETGKTSVGDFGDDAPVGRRIATRNAGK